MSDLCLFLRLLGMVKEHVELEMVLNITPPANRGTSLPLVSCKLTNTLGPRCNIMPSSHSTDIKSLYRKAISSALVIHHAKT